ncbi:shikimate kinase [Aequorivita echinoideorum]|uniref:Shikimate kinase n=1 Tax=Aequorivita echinoideorum TaxID=1549647 RepID=A0ABS5S752_9FLAO|nr:shikimate kinase [Aequorivita echinoideorum]MBT0609009.1 shikimate kinase [Aequorivita echinoideorum]
MKIILFGYMGSGKSSVGKNLADKLSLKFLDLDAEIESVEGKNIASIFSDKGEIYFRKKENEILKKLVAENGSFVMATGGGTPCYGNTLEYIKDQKDIKSVYLKNSIKQLTERLFAERAQRPLISHLESKSILEDFIRKHLFERAFYYNQADSIVDVENLSIPEIVQHVNEKLF